MTCGLVGFGAMYNSGAYNTFVYNGFVGPFAICLDEAVNVLDTLSKLFITTKNESLNVADVILHVFRKYLPEHAVFITDAISKKAIITKDETFNLSEQILNSVHISRTETFNILDALVKSGSITKEEQFLIVDNIQKEPKKNLTETITLLDLFRQSFIFPKIILPFHRNLASVIQNGFIKNGQQMLKTGSGGVLRVNLFDGSETPCELLKVFPTYEEFQFKTPWIAISRIDVADIKLVGQWYRYELAVTVDMAFREEHTKVVGSDTLRGDDLAKYFLEHIQKALTISAKEFTLVKVHSPRTVATLPQRIDFADSTIYGFRLQLLFEVTYVLGA